MEFGRAHSSSQRSSDQIGNTPPPSCQSLQMTLAGPPPPAGVIVFSPSSHVLAAAIAHLHIIRARDRRIRATLCAQCIGAILDRLYTSGQLHTIFNSSIGAAHSSSQRPSIWIGDTPPPGCRSEQSDARWISSPSGRCLFSGPGFWATTPATATRLRHAFRRHARGYRRTEACIPCMGAMQHCLCNFCSERLYFRASDDGQQER